MKKDFNPDEYWQSRLSGMYRKEGVGYLSFGEGFNVWFYKASEAVFRACLREAGGDPREWDVLDVGSGTGFYIGQWKSAGAKSIRGTDFTQVAIENLGKMYPDCSFELGDIGSAELQVEGAPFDAVSPMGVLFHIVDDDRFLQALRNLHGLLKDDGLMFYSDNFIHGGRFTGVHQVSRSLEEISEALDEIGFDVVIRRPLRYFMDAPVDTTNPFLRGSWKLVRKVCRLGKFPSYAMGALLYPWERLMTSVMHESPTMEVMVCRKRKTP